MTFSSLTTSSLNFTVPVVKSRGTENPEQESMSGFEQCSNIFLEDSPKAEERSHFKFLVHGFDDKMAVE